MTATVEGRTATVRPSVQAVLTREQLAEVVRLYQGADAFVVDVETVGPHRGDPTRNDVLWIGLATEGFTHVIPLGHPNGELTEMRREVLPSGIERLKAGKTLLKSNVSSSDAKARRVFSDPPAQLTPGEVFTALEPLFFNDTQTVVGHNVRFDLRSIAKYYRHRLPTTRMFDTVVGEFLTNDLLQHQLSLDKCVKRRLHYDMAKGVGAKVEAYPFWEVARYLHLDCKMTWLLFRDEVTRLDRAKLGHLMELEMDLAEVLMDMEHTGTLIDTQALEELRGELEQAILFATASAYRINGGQFNLNSVADLQKALFTEEGQNLTPEVFTEKKGEPSTSDAALSHFPNNPLVRELLRIREYKKLLSTYVIPYLGGEVTHTVGGKTKVETRESSLVNSRIHTNYKQHGAKTGRLSSSKPNLQNIPNPEKSEYGKRIRNAFIADPGHRFVQADWSQVEPRIMASLSHDPIMTQAFMDGEDVYRAIADPLNQPRSAGKLLILAMAYGVGPDKIANSLSMTMSQARQLLRDFEQRFPSLTKHKESVVKQAARRRPVPYSTTVLGRRRFLPGLLSDDFKERGSGQRQAFNHLIQGTASDAMKIALIRIHRTLPENSRLLLTVHDEVVVLAPLEEVDETVEAVKTGMEGVRLPGITVPLLADVKVVDRWGEAK